MTDESMILLENYEGDKEFKNLIFAVSFEDRGFLSLKRIIENFYVERCFPIVFDNYFVEQYNNLEKRDIGTVNKYKYEYKNAIKYLKQKNLTYNEIKSSIFNPDGIIDKIKNINLSEPTLVDISCIPKNYILLMLNYLRNVVFIYSKVKKYSEKEEDFVTGVRDVISLPGFSGKIRHRDSLLVLILGFQGNRALSIYRRYNPYRTLVLIPEPQGSEDKEGVKIVVRNNKGILKNQFVYIEKIIGFSPKKFKKQLQEKINTFAEKNDIDLSNFNLILSPLGPKPDILGIYKYWLKQKNTQLSYSLPTRYRNSSEGIRDTYIMEYQKI